MPATSSREARSARREAMKSSTNKPATKARVTKPSTKSGARSKSASKLLSKALNQDAVATKEDSKASDPQDSRATPEPEHIYNESAAAAESLPESSLVTDPEACGELSVPEISTPPPLELYEPLTPPKEDQKDQEHNEQDPKLAFESTMTEDELQTYIREFEATYRGTDSEAEEAVEPLSPSDASFESKPSSPLALDYSYEMPSDLSDEGLDFSYFGPEEIRFDDYIDYSNDTQETDAVEVSHEKPKRICVYRSHAEPNPALFSVNPNKRTLVAAWQTVVADAHYSTREAYLHSVLLAAASLNQRSLLSGHARQTMAPALGTSH